MTWAYRQEDHINRIIFYSKKFLLYKVYREILKLLAWLHNYKWLFAFSLYYMYTCFHQCVNTEIKAPDAGSYKSAGFVNITGKKGWEKINE